MARQPTYPSDLTDEQFALLQPLIPRAKPGGRPRRVDLRAVLDAIFYVTKTGCQWRYLPRDFPPRSTANGYLRGWQADGTWALIQQALRDRVRAAAGLDQSTTASVDSQSIKTTGAAEDVGYDGGKKVKGRKRHVAVDSLGLLLAVAVTGAGVSDADGAELALGQLSRPHLPGLKRVFADSAYHRHRLYEWIDRRAWYELEIVSRPLGSAGWVLTPKRWVVERTLGWLIQYRRLARDYEKTSRSSTACIYVSQIHLMLRRLSRTKLQPACPQLLAA